MANKNPVNRKNSSSWREEEEKYFIKNFPILDNEILSKKLGKTEKAIRSKAVQLNLKKKDYFWTKKDEEFLKKNYEFMGYEDLMKKLKRTKWAVINKYRELMKFR